MDEYLEHHGIKGQRWGVRNYQDMMGRLTAAGRERYGVGDGSGVEHLKKTLGRYKKGAGTVKSIVGRKAYPFKSASSGGVFDSSNTVSKQAKRLGKFGVELAKAKSYQYANTGQYNMRNAKAKLASVMRGKKVNSEIARANQLNMWDYTTARRQAQFLIRTFGGDSAKKVLDQSNERFARRISVGKSYVHDMERFMTRTSSRINVARGVIDSHNMSYENYSRPVVSSYRNLLKGSARLRRS